MGTTTHRYKIGDVEILAFSDAVVDYPWPLTELYPDVPLEAWTPYRARYPGAFGGENVLRLDYGCYLIRSQGRTVLVDTGMGPATTPWAAFLKQSGTLLSGLEAAGVQPGEVDIVVLTHLHPDHVGWALTQEGASCRATFPRARYVVHRADWDAFQTPEVQAHFPFSYVDETITPLRELGVLELIDGERALTDELTTLHTPGHTPGHMSVLVSSAGERGIILGDVMLHPAEVTEPDWKIMFEMDPAMTVKTRRRVLERIEAEGLHVVACHFPDPGIGQIVRVEGRRYWQALGS